MSQSTEEAYLSEIADLTATVAALQEEARRIAERVGDLEYEKSELQDDVDSLIDEKETLTGDLESERDFNEAARVLVRALDTYLSWSDCPPPGMNEEDRKSYLANFRRDLDDARRAVTE
jgi:predicted nuclease with TOPRIM domain